MGTEIEKKFLVKDRSWQGLAVGENYCQGYLNAEKDRTVRIRIIGERGILTIKGPSISEVRPEYEYIIPVGDAREMLDLLCHKPLIEKIRYAVPFAGFIWEIDEFKGENAGLVIAEIELDHVGQTFVKPAWVGPEVTGDARYYNANLVKNPYSVWAKQTS